jgi:nicotinate-nucleotide adenylyltransferase
MQMLQAALAGVTWASVDDRELRRDGPSWSVITLRELRTEYPGRSLCMILGMDAFLGLPGWHRWEEIIELTNLIVVHRPGWVPPTSGTPGDMLAAHRAAGSNDLHLHTAGRILLQEVTQLEISSSAIRELLEAGREPRYLLPDRVLELIRAHGCYAGHTVG